MNFKPLNVIAATVAVVCIAGMIGCSSGTNTMPNTPPVMAIVPYIPGVTNTSTTTTTTTATPPPPSQSHSVNGTFGQPLVAFVTSNGEPASGVVVTFQAPTSGASGTFAGKGTIATAKSNSQGLATAPAFTADGTVGTYSVLASIAASSTPASFTMINTTGVPATVTVSAGGGQTAPIGTPFGTALTVKVVDSGDNPVSNAMVVFTAPATGASGTFTTPTGASTGSTIVLTDAAGTAAASTFTANNVSGAVTVTASVSGTTSPAIFSLTNAPGPVQFVTAISGTPQNTVADKNFNQPFSVSVTDGQMNPISGAVVTFSAPTTGASGTFFFEGNSTNSATATTNASGIAIMTAPFMANSTAGAYFVTASVSGTNAQFSMNNWPLGSLFYSYYLSGVEGGGTQFVGDNGYYALAGSVVVDPANQVLAGEQDYNDGSIVTSPQPTGDTITGGTLTINSTNHNGTMVLDTNNHNIGPSGSGVITLAVQFVNSNHALIIEYDGAATSSGSLDVQPLPLSAPLAGSFAFTLSGVDPSFMPVGYGGIFSIGSGGTILQSGIVDTNDSETSAPPVLGQAFSGTLTAPDTFGRGTITSTLNYGAAYGFTGEPTPIVLNYYVVGKEAIRIIDVDSTDSAVGSAFGQGASANTFSDASLGASIFGIEGTYLDQYGAAGMFSTNTSGSFSGVGDDAEPNNGVLVSDATLSSGTYSIGGNGYGSFTVPSSTLGDVSSLGLYMTDPNLNLLDPNNTTGTGGALLLDLDTILAGGTGTIIPQTNTSTASFSGDYGFGAQLQDSGLEIDFVGSGAVTSGAFSGRGGLSDPYQLLGESSTTGKYIADFSTTPLPDPINVGRYTMLSTNSTPNPLVVTIAGVPTDFDVVMYQASGDQLFWLNEDFSSVFLGSFQQFGLF